MDICSWMRLQSSIKNGLNERVISQEIANFLRTFLLLSHSHSQSFHATQQQPRIKRSESTDKEAQKKEEISEDSIDN